MSPAQNENKKYRCHECNKKLTAVSYFSCRCSTTFVFCSTHRYSHAHKCTLDHKKINETLLNKQNPIVQSSKLDKI